MGFFITQPNEVHLAFGDDGVTFTRPGPPYTLADGTLPAIMQGKRGDVALPVQASGRYAQITLVVGSAGGSGMAIDEVAFE